MILSSAALPSSAVFQENMAAHAAALAGIAYVFNHDTAMLVLFFALLIVGFGNPKDWMGRLRPG